MLCRHTRLTSELSFVIICVLSFFQILTVLAESMRIRFLLWIVGLVVESSALRSCMTMPFDPISKLHKLVKNEMDNIDILNECRKIGIETEVTSDFSHLKLQLQYSLLEHILKSEIPNKSQFWKLMRITEKCLNKRSGRRKGYQCRIVGCLF